MSRSANVEASHLASMFDETVYRKTNARMVRSELLEVFTKVHPVVPALIFVPVVIYFAWRGVRAEGVAVSVAAAAGGGLFWTFTEYTLHRFVFHLSPTNRVKRFFYFYTHGIHHAYPDDYYRLVMVPVISVPLAYLFYALFHAVLPPGLAAGAFAGMVAGYLVYDYVHFATHHVTPPRAAFMAPLAEVMKQQRRRHMRHHFEAPDRAYGVSTELWDHVFGTQLPKTRQRPEAESESDSKTARAV